MNGKTNGDRFDFPSGESVTTRCPCCGRPLFVSRSIWEETTVESAEVLVICPARRGGWACKQRVALRRKNEGRPT